LRGLEATTSLFFGRPRFLLGLGDPQDVFASFSRDSLAVEHWLVCPASCDCVFIGDAYLPTHIGN
jgi:hypothetical protein